LLYSWGLDGDLHSLSVLVFIICAMGLVLPPSECCIK
jgi:hypothetical protein